MEVTLTQMLKAREARAMEQRRLLEEYGKPVLSFTMNIPGPVKDTPLIRRGFAWGQEALSFRVPKGKLLYQAARMGVTGCEALYVVDMDPAALKAAAVQIEDDTPLGRLFDMDVLDPQGNQLRREGFGGKSRDCLVCGQPGRGCASRRSHTVAQLQQAVEHILRDHFAREDSETIGSWAVLSLLEEVATTPKPGLVDGRNCGSHRDMDAHTFRSSAAALGPYFTRCAKIGMETAQEPPEKTFAALRPVGRAAEQTMYRATGGVNTHKGAIFTLGILCGAAGRLWKEDARWEPERLFREVAAMTGQAMAEELAKGGDDTAGQRLYTSRGISGIRGEAAQGLPSVEHIGLPVYRALRRAGKSQNDAGAVTLLHLIARVTDTNMLSRGGEKGAAVGAAWALQLIEGGAIPTREQIEALDDRFIRENLSPGGCADLLAAVYFVEKLRSAAHNLFRGS